MSRSPSVGVGSLAPDPHGVFHIPLERARFLRRYRRFLADVERADGSVVTVHVPNTGSMATLDTPGATAWIAAAANPARKLAWTLTLLGLPDGGVALVDTQWPNRVVAAGITAGRLPTLAGYAHLRREVGFGTRGSRVDLTLSGHPQRADAYIEVKNVTMLGSAGVALFPDAVSTRGSKHLDELADVARAGHRAVQYYCVSRTDCHHVGLAHHIDPAYVAAAQRAHAAGVEFLAHRLDFQPLPHGWNCAVGAAVPVTLTSGH